MEGSRLAWKASAAAAAFAIALAVMATILPGASAAPPVPVGRIIFQDEFSGPLNRTVWDPFITDNPANGAPWNYQSGQQRLSSAEGRPGSFNLDYDLPSLIRTNVPGVGLSLGAQTGSTAQGYSWSGSVICSYPDTAYGTKGFTFNSAYIEICAKMPDDLMAGGWPAIWFLAAPGSHGREIDLFEGGFTKGDADPAHVMATTLQGYKPNGGISQVLTDTAVDLSAGYHTYGLAYKSGQYIKCYFDGKLVALWSGDRMEADNFSGSYYIILCNAVAGTSSASWRTAAGAATSSPNAMDVKYVKVWRLK